ncbi:MAG: cardiolipin synthase ClsB [Burkholderiales bacterium]|nr:cardiolipin synthase ClsB [Burkholderiales bacterium]
MTWTPGNRLTLLRSGAEYFPAMLRAIDEAQRELFLESYLFRNDATGRRVAAALARAARRGVAVQVLLDGFGAGDLAAQQRRAMERAGVRLLFFRPDSFRLHFKRERLRRLHRKLVVVDGNVGFVGGINIIDDRVADLAPRYDYALQVEGPLVADMRAAAAKQWRQTCWRQIKADWSHLPRRPAPPEVVGDTNAQFVRRDNLRHRRDIEAAYVHAIQHARDEIILAHAYFLPGITLRHALLAAAKRRTRVVLLLQGRIDHALLFFATRVLYRPLLAVGVEIYEYRAGYMHAKVAVIDRIWLTVGSSNIDPFSLLTAREANVVARDTFLAGALRDDILRHIEHDAVKVEMGHTRHSVWNRMLAWVAYLMVRVILGLTGYGKKEYRE